jgi:murein DD-endopeptidase MepM/ murein hydrolase activator NlpD
MKILTFIFSIILPTIIFLFFGVGVARPQVNVNVGQNTNINDLQKLIEQKSSELKIIEGEKENLQKKLEEISSYKESLDKEVKSIGFEISQLNLKIKANRLTSERLSLELDSLENSINEIKNQIAQKKQTISRLIVELQQRENESLLFTVLGSNTLSESINRTNTIFLLNKGLLESIENLNNLENSLQEKMGKTKEIKLQKEQEEIDFLNTQNILQNQKELKNYILNQTKNEEKIYEEKIEKLEEQQLSISRIIEEAENKLRATFNPNLLPTPSKTVFSLPVYIGKITQKYGYTKFAERAYKTNFHTGIDFGVPLGTPVYAAASGIVLRVDNNDRGIARWNRYQYGKYILIKHENNLTTLYAHLSKQIVKNGDIIKRGDLIGYSGNSGYTFGAHLHFGVYYTPELELKKVPPANGLVPIGITVDPLNYLP